MSRIGAHQSAKSATTSWLTPPDWIARLGPFDLDPCTPQEGMPWSTAAAMLRPSDDGLACSWGEAFVWMNPPYGPPPVIEPWMRKMAKHGYGIALIFARTDTVCWHEYVFPFASAILFVKGRPRFHYPDGTQAKANCGGPIALVGYGVKAQHRLLECEIDGHLYVR